uniref:N-acetyltransferase n=1 Tax=Oryza sativa subsp. japonica TaxID=39947 RepID=Q8LNG6_ORYSJ|nr:putative N-acetyltransferase [Oryza sativa Japonica Group]
MAAAAAAATAARILELDPAHPRAGRVIDDIVRTEKRIFPKHESLARTFHDELKRRNTTLIYSAAAATIPTTGDAAAASDEEEEVVGYAMYTCATSLCASITKLAVKESRRRQGHGEALLMAAVEGCRRRRVQRVSLHVDPARAAAVALYRKAGFQVDATVVGYYAPRRDAYRMKCKWSNMFFANCDREMLRDGILFERDAISKDRLIPVSAIVADCEYCLKVSQFS